MLLHRKDLECAVKTGHTDLIIDKNRRGETGTKPLIFLGPHTVFIEP
jgi:replicative DNA helicase